jgi:hypothetical protein
MQVIVLDVLVVGVIETREFILERLDFFGCGTTTRRIMAQRLHHSNNKLLVDEWERKLLVVMIDKIQLDELERMNDDLVSHNDNIIDFGNDMRVTGNGFEGCLYGLVLGPIGWFPLGFWFSDRGGHGFFLIEMDFFRSFCFGREKILGGADPSTVRETMLNVLADDRIMVFQKIPDDAEIRAVEFMRFRNTRDGGTRKIKTDRWNKRHNTSDEFVITIKMITDERRCVVKI